MNRHADWALRFPKRLTGKEKDRFLGELEAVLTERGWPTQRITTGRFLRNRLLLTQCEQPSVIFLAHYDTPTKLPFWISWLYQVWGHTRQISAILFLLILLQIPRVLRVFVPDLILLDTISSLVPILLLLSLSVMLIPNRHNREDNTSGVLGLMALADYLKDKPGIQKQVQFAFLDNEELGLLGSLALKKHWDDAGYPYPQADIISLDCIARGRKPLLIYHKSAHLAQKLLPAIQSYLPETKLMNMGIMPLSDNYTFQHLGAVDISFANPALVPGGYYIPRIHCSSDKDFTPERFWPLVQALGQYVTTTQA